MNFTHLETNPFQNHDHMVSRVTEQTEKTMVFPVDWSVFVRKFFKPSCCFALLRQVVSELSYVTLRYVVQLRCSWSLRL